ncbi:hypothetical protein H5410_041129 [Solanum commersonii]|uniref:RNase H type-1 domain-containing protein n=1 Tax=Solanum commersonii TaxID=4109 RepID=A0A9J5XST3_SOLCO|nr:hypothetical protein H5410_041129 [Solanum commersonii]
MVKNPLKLILLIQSINFNNRNKGKGSKYPLDYLKSYRREWKVPWRILHIINEVQELVEKNGFEIKQCFREANRPTDKLASMSHNFESIHVFYSHIELPNQVKGLVNMDKWDIHSFRIKMNKPSHIIYDPP